MSRPGVCAAAALIGALLVPPFYGENSPPADGERSYAIEWSVKLSYRGRYLWRKIGVDQWSGARLLTNRRPLPDGGALFSLVKPLEDPWVFRWYPSKSELKLGASIWVKPDEVRGDPYAALARLLEPKAERLARLWSEDPFWEECRRREPLRPRLSDPPTYPFHVLGDPANRFRFRVSRDGGVDRESGVERMSEPWLPDGWKRAADGDRSPGIGYWERKRPDWEPHGYPAIFRSLDWLERIDPATGATGIDLGALAEVVETLNPQIGGRLDWRERIEWKGSDSGDRDVQGGKLRARVQRVRRGTGDDLSDELRATLIDTDGGCRLRLEVQLSYAPFEDSESSRSSNPSTKERISSRTRR